MKRKISSSFLAAFAFSLTCSGAFAQGHDDWTDKLADRETHFTFQTILGLGTLGIQKSHHAMLLDENGFAYDTTSVLHDNTCEEIGMDETQIEAFRKIYAGSMKDMKAHSASAIFVEDQSELELIFRQAQEEIRGHLTDQQLKKLEHIRHQKGVEKVGFEKYFSSSHFAENPEFTEADRQGLSSLAKNLERERKASWRSLLEQGNRELLKQLSQEQRDRLEEAIQGDFESQFVKSPMFVKYAGFAKQPFRVKRNLGRTLKLTKIQKALEMTEVQIEKAKTFRGLPADSVSDILTSFQVSQLDQILVMKDLEKMGTVNAMGCGRIADLLSLTKDETRAIHRAGREILAQLNEQASEKHQEKFESELAQLSPALAQCLRQSLGHFRPLSGYSRITR